MSVAEQAEVFGAMALLGAALMAAYGLTALLLRLMHAGAVLRGIADVAFGALCAAGITAAAIALRVQAMRWYVFAGTAAGMAALAAPAVLVRKGLRYMRGVFGGRWMPKRRKIDEIRHEV